LLRVLFVHTRPYLPQLLGGVETTTFDLCRQLALMGHEAAVICELGKHDGVWLRNRIASRLSGRRFPRGSYRGATVYRGYDPGRGLPEVVEDFRPDVLVVQGAEAAFAVAAECARTRVPTSFYFHELVSARKRSDFTQLDGMPLLANSAYTAKVLQGLLGREAAVVPPLVDAAAYRTATTRSYVTMVNPRKIKGGEIALELARACPDIPFLFLEAWHADDEFVDQLRAATRSLNNVTWRQATTNMLGVYAGTRILLMPSRWEETWGRVATEAQASGIPVLATDRAALPESVGPGGILVPPDAPIEDWVRALRSLWDDHSLYDTLSARALAFAARPEAQPAQRAAAFIAALSQPVSRHTFQGQSPRASMRS
jgi:glycosyltransferase involved in cell wall biosynthesis